MWSTQTPFIIQVRNANQTLNYLQSFDWVGWLDQELWGAFATASVLVHARSGFHAPRISIFTSERNLAFLPHIENQNSYHWEKSVHFFFFPFRQWKCPAPSNRTMGITENKKKKNKKNILRVKLRCTCHFKFWFIFDWDALFSNCFNGHT